MKNPIAARLTLSILITTFPAWTPLSQAYQVWTSTCRSPDFIANQTDQWAIVAKNVQGLNINFAPSESSQVNPTPTEWKQILARYHTANKNTFTPFARRAFDPAEFASGSADNYMVKQTTRAMEWGYTLDYVMLYDSHDTAGAPMGSKIVSWSDSDVTLLRSWLDANGHAKIKMLYNARSFESRDLIAHPAIDGILNEGNPEYWSENKAGRRELLKWAVTTPGVKEKPFFFQITVHHSFEAGDTYEAVRGFIRSISADILGSTDWVKTDKAIFLPMSYQDFPETFPFLPETDSTGSKYGNTMAGLLCSLIEQKDLLSGRNGPLISEAECKSFKRAKPPVIVIGALPGSGIRPIPNAGPPLRVFDATGRFGSADRRVILRYPLP